MTLILWINLNWISFHFVHLQMFYSEVFRGIPIQLHCVIPSPWARLASRVNISLKKKKTKCDEICIRLDSSHSSNRITPQAYLCEFIWDHRGHEVANKYCLVDGKFTSVPLSKQKCLNFHFIANILLKLCQAALTRLTSRVKTITFNRGEEGLDGVVAFKANV